MRYYAFAVMSSRVAYCPRCNDICLSLTLLAYCDTQNASFIQPFICIYVLALTLSVHHFFSVSLVFIIIFFFIRYNSKMKRRGKKEVLLKSWTAVEFITSKGNWCSILIPRALLVYLLLFSSVQCIVKSSSHFADWIPEVRGCIHPSEQCRAKVRANFATVIYVIRKLYLILFQLSPRTGCVRVNWSLNRRNST